VLAGLMSHRPFLLTPPQGKHPGRQLAWRQWRAVPAM